MVVYFHNAHAEALESLCRREIADGTATPEQLAALSALVDEIERQKQCAPFQLWRRAQGDQP